MAEYTPSEIAFTDKIDVQLVSHNVSDEMVLHAARVSTTGEMGEGVAWTDRDNGLIRYLMNNLHLSPFEHGSATFFIHAPIFVVREWQRHRTWSYNEESARYKKLDPLFYVPNAGRPLIQEGKVGHYTFGPGTEDQYLSTEYNLQHAYRTSYNAYERLIEEGVAGEVARSVLPVGIYTSFYATANVRNILAFLALRNEEFAQYEIRDAASQVQNIMQLLAPRTVLAWLDNK
jgi:thymidylate synthase (FAD)